MVHLVISRNFFAFLFLDPLRELVKMRLFRDALCPSDELFTDAFPIKEIAEGAMYEVCKFHCVLVSMFHFIFTHRLTQNTFLYRWRIILILEQTQVPMARMNQ